MFLQSGSSRVQRRNSTGLLVWQSMKIRENFTSQTTSAIRFLSSMSPTTATLLRDRVIQGPKTQFDWPTGLAVDEDKGELYVANDIGNSILVFNVTDNGDVAPRSGHPGSKDAIRLAYWFGSR